MANITRFDPFSDLDDIFKGFMVRPVFKGAPALPQFKLDLSENEQAYTIKAEIPGVKKEDIQISVDGNVVSISAEVKQEREQKAGEKVVHSERYYGQVARSFSLDREVDEAGAKATYTDGVLEAVLPKKAGSVAKRISVS